MTNLSMWTDEELLKRCRLKGDRPWQVLVETQNRITQNDRHPLMPPEFDFCRFLESYRDPYYKNML